ncbi:MULTISPECIES: hypothetical protein [Bacillus cereus group]|uniref:hypothetical protein n=1 Tax=Bacillus cereus group TaxID=86661 RepID=UPI00040D9CDE|nr:MULTISPECIES: hypothetical protein [Bacillus cereus group]QDF25039.1 hypothetical protein FJR70_19290 [Bacillus tropicus]
MEAARLECEGDGASDVEALFASQEEAKPPNILAAGTGLEKSGSGLLTTRRCQCKEWKQQRFIKNKRESQLLSK